MGRCRKNDRLGTNLKHVTSQSNYVLWCVVLFVVCNTKWNKMNFLLKLTQSFSINFGSAMNKIFLHGNMSFWRFMLKLKYVCRQIWDNVSVYQDNPSDPFDSVRGWHCHAFSGNNGWETCWCGEVTSSLQVSWPRQAAIWVVTHLLTYFNSSSAGVIQQHPQW